MWNVVIKLIPGLLLVWSKQGSKRAGRDIKHILEEMSNFNLTTWRDRLGDVGIGRRIILKLLRCYQVQAGAQWKTVINTVMNLRVLQKTWNFLTCWVAVILSRRAVLVGGSSYRGSVVRDRLGVISMALTRPVEYYRCTFRERCG